MLDSGIARMGLFAFIFLIAFVGFLALIPSGFLINTKEYGNPASSIPDSWYGTSLEGYNFTDSWNTTLSNSFGQTQYYAKIGNRELGIQSSIGLAMGTMRIYYRYGLGLLFIEDMLWFNNKGIRVSEHGIGGMLAEERISSITINTEYSSNNVVYKVECLGKSGAWVLGSSSYFYVTAILGFNTTTYDTPYEAWLNGNLNLFLGINPSNVNFARDVWFLLTSLMAFNTAEVFGSNDFTSITLNWIVCSFVYGAIIIFATAVALEVLPNWL